DRVGRHPRRARVDPRRVVRGPEAAGLHEAGRGERAAAPPVLPAVRGSRAVRDLPGPLRPLRPTRPRRSLPPCRGLSAPRAARGASAAARGGARRGGRRGGGAEGEGVGARLRRARNVRAGGPAPPRPTRRRRRELPPPPPRPAPPPP